MKLKSLILGSVAAAGLSTAGFAADLGVLTSLDVCDELGLSGLTISSDTNCLQISGNVKYEFYWGDYKDEPVLGVVPLTDSILGGSGDITTIGAGGPADSELDWRSKVSAWLKFVGTASSDFGTAKAVLKLNYQDRWDVRNEAAATPHGDNGLVIDEAYVSVGDSTVIMAGKKSTIGVFSDSTPFNYLGLFGVGEVDSGVLLEGDEDGFGGHVIQVVSDLGNGVSVGLGLENLAGYGDNVIDPVTHAISNPGRTSTAGTLVGVVSYKGDAFTAHLTGFTGGLLDGTAEFYGFHAGATGTFDAFKLRGALGYLYNDLIADSKLHAMLTAEGTFDLFTIALSGEYVDGYAGTGGYGLGGSVGAAVTEGVKINLGARWWYNDLADDNTTQVSAQIVADIAEGLAVTAEVGGYFGDTPVLAASSIGYVGLGLNWNPGGDFKSSIKGEVTTESAYKVSFTAEKAFN